MPRLTVRNVADVPRRSAVSKAVREKQQVYEQFIHDIGANVGELEPAAGEELRSIKVRLRRAATRLNQPIEIWDADGRVYFASSQQKRRGRPPKVK